MEQDWQDYRTEIVRLYLEENMTLAKVIETMEGAHGFKKTYPPRATIPSYRASLMPAFRESQYLTQFARWGVKKNYMGAERSAGVKRKLEKVEGQEYEVYVDRIQHCPKKLKRKANRQVFTPVIEKFTSGKLY
jgi:hypothetical protein